MKTPSPPRQEDAKTSTAGSQPGANASADQQGLAPELSAQGFSEAALLGADWFWEMDAELRYTFQSSGFEEITGLAATEVIGKTREDAFAGRVEDSEGWRRQAEVLRRREDHSSSGLWPPGPSVR